MARGKKGKGSKTLKHEIMGLSLLALALLILVGLLSGDGGFIGRVLGGLLRRSVGVGAYLVPVFFLFTGIIFMHKEQKVRSPARITGAFLLFSVFLTFFHLRFPLAEVWTYGWQGQGGGLLGAGLTYLFLNFFGLTGSYVVLITIALIGCLLVTNISITSLLNRVVKKLSSMFSLGKGVLTRVITFRNHRQEEEEEEEVERDLLVLGAQVEKEPDREELTFLEDPKDDFNEVSAGEVQSTQKAAEGSPLLSSLPRRTFSYQVPPLSLLRRNQRYKDSRWQKEINENTRLLEDTLGQFGVKAKVIEVSRGPAITRYELQLAPGTKVSRVVSLADDISLHMAAVDVRIEAPIPGKAAVGIEVPNREIAPVFLREVVESPAFQNNPSKLTFALGKDVAGEPVVADLGTMPHLLIAGATGAGKSVYLNALLASFLFRVKPDEVKFLLVDPKRVELSVYNDMPHLLAPVVVDPQQAAAVLCWLVQEMENRYNLFAQRGVRDIAGYNRSLKGNEREELFIPFIVVIVDELADLMMVAPSEVEDSICRLAQMARAAGIHLVIATQRPSVDVITGLIKANVPSRLSFAVSSQTDSRTILDTGGAEKLLGKGDMLFLSAGASKPLRIQGAFISDREVEKLVAFWRQQAEPEYREEVLEAEITTKKGRDQELEEDELFLPALNLVVEQKQASASMLQRRFRIGYTRAARLIDLMEEKGYVGPSEGSKPRQVLVSRERLQHLLEGEG